MEDREELVQKVNVYLEKDVYSVNDTGDSEKNPSSPNRSRTYELLVTSPDALPLSNRRLVGAKAIKLGSCDKRPAYC